MKWGLTKDLMNSCVYKWLCLGRPKSSAEHGRWYITTQIRKPDKIPVAQCKARRLKLTEYLTLLPCYKDKEVSPQE